MAVLDVLQDENLPENARLVGAHARTGLARLAERHESIGDVRGYGLFFGAEIVTDRTTKTPAPNYVMRVANEMRRRGILMNKLGINANTLKIRPPMPFSIENADLMLETLDAILTDVGPARD
jgi:4-aminobutyrate aminotransferase-like enzyme